MDIEKIYKVLKSTSDGYLLVDRELNNQDFFLAKTRKKTSFLYGNIVIGDNVYIDNECNISKICERTNLLQRPKVANLDLVLILISLKQPDYSSYLLDKFLTSVNKLNIKPIIVFTKSDLLSKKEKIEFEKEASYYKKFNYEVFFLSKHSTEEELGILRSLLKGKETAVMGQTGVGKSSLLNRLDPNFNFREGDYQLKDGISRGKHITKEVIIKIIDNDGFIADTPGFSSFDLNFEKIEDIKDNFPCIKDYEIECKFKDCMHENINKNGVCAINDKFISQDKIHLIHYNNYIKILNETKEVLKKNGSRFV